MARSLRSLRASIERTTRTWHKLSWAVFLLTISSVTKLRRILKSHGYKFENRKVAKNDDLLGDATAAETPKKASTAKNAKTKATPTPKKRKVEEVADGEEVMNEGANE